MKRYVLVACTACLCTIIAATLKKDVKPEEFEHGIIQFGVVVEDFDKAIDFYTNVIGMTQTGGFDIDEDFGRRSGLSGGEPFKVAILQLIDGPENTQWKVLSFNKKPTHKKPKYIQDDNGVQYVTIYVKNMDPFLERIKANNVKLLGETPTECCEGKRFVLVQDPDGNFIELIGD